MDIDNMARAALQSEKISNHVDDMMFETTMAAPVEDVNTGESIRTEVSSATLATFWGLEKCFITIILSIGTVIVFVNSCNDHDPLVGNDDNNSGDY